MIKHDKGKHTFSADNSAVLIFHAGMQDKERYSAE
jgi:hypothetical protein